MKNFRAFVLKEIRVNHLSNFLSLLGQRSSYQKLTCNFLLANSSNLYTYIYFLGSHNLTTVSKLGPLGNTYFLKNS